MLHSYSNTFFPLRIVKTGPETGKFGTYASTISNKKIHSADDHQEHHTVMEVGRVRPPGQNPQSRREVQRPEGGKGELPSNRLNRISKLTTSTAFILQHGSFNLKTRLLGISLSPASGIYLKNCYSLSMPAFIGVIPTCQPP